MRLLSVAQSHPINNPGQIDGKALFYLTGFVLEIMVVILFAAARFDLRFHVPNGCTGPGQYGASVPDKEDDQEALFEEVDVKMRMGYESSIRAGLDGEAVEAQGRVKRWQEVGVDRTNATREQVRQAIDDLRLNSELVGSPMDAGDSELLVYTFRVRKSGSVGKEDVLKRPPRSKTWVARHWGEGDEKEDEM